MKLIKQICGVFLVEMCPHENRLPMDGEEFKAVRRSDCLCGYCYYEYDDECDDEEFE